eukprot:m.277803 g.277803  ORF g.277803 m.277803 type:complete len:494 (-) comp54880_c0_seq1:85-1566(-)
MAVARGVVLLLALLLAVAVARVHIYEEEDDESAESAVSAARGHVHDQDFADADDDALALTSEDSEEDNEPESPRTKQQQDDEDPDDDDNEDDDEEEEARKRAKQSKNKKDQRAARSKKQAARKQQQRGDETSAESSDEFEYVVYNKNQKLAESHPHPTLNIPKHARPGIFDGGIEKLWLEVFLLAGLVAYGINYLLGRAKNLTIASRWESELSELLHSQFARVGGENNQMIRESASDFLLYASGRRNCDCLSVNLSLTKRQDLLSVFYGMTGMESTDAVSIYIESPRLPEFTFAVMQAKNEKRFLEEMDDVKLFCKRSSGEAYKLPANLVVYTDCGDVAPHILTPQVLEIITDRADQWVILHVTDQAYPGKLTAALAANDADQLEKIDEPKTLMCMQFRVAAGHIDVVPVEVMLTMLDALAHVQLNNSAASKKRDELDEKIQKIIRASKEKNADKHKKKMENLSADQRAKLAELEAKRRQRRQQKKGTVVFAR